MATMTAEQAGIKLGDVFTRSWGYDQTNVNYYLVVGITPSGKSVKLREVGSTCIDDPHAPATHVVPDTTRFIDDGDRWCVNCKQRTHVRNGLLEHSATMQADCINDEGYETGTQVQAPPPTIYTKRIQAYPQYNSDEVSVYLAFNSYSSLSKWDGRAKYQTGFGWGH